MQHGSALRESTKKVLGRYELMGLLATGGMAEVHLARLMGPSGFERVVCVKRILPHLAREAEFVDMFVDEARIVAKIHHKNVVQVSELSRDGDELFIAMELVHGESLGSFMRRHWTTKRAIGVELAAHIVAEACAGLHAAHELVDDQGRPQEVVHRDVSPQNLMITYTGQVKVLDFGVAKAVDRVSQRTQTGTLKGKVEYMAPEQCAAKPVDRRADVFSLGVLLYELTTGKRLFRRDSDLVALLAVTQDPIPLPSTVVEGYPPLLEAIVLKALSRPLEGRFTSAEEMRRELIKYLRTTPHFGLYDEELAVRMGELFRERDEEKSELLRQLTRGETTAAVPAAEVDLGVAVPVVPTIAASAPRALSVPPAAPPPKSRTSAALMGALAIAGVAGVVVIGWTVFGPSRSNATTAEGDRATATALATSTSTAASTVAISPVTSVGTTAAAAAALTTATASSSPSDTAPRVFQRPRGDGGATTKATAAPSSRYRKFD